MGGPQGLSADLVLPTELEFWEAVSDCSNVLISAAGRQIPANSLLLEQQSPVFRGQLAALLDGKESLLYEKVSLSLLKGPRESLPIAAFSERRCVGDNLARHLLSSALAHLSMYALDFANCEASAETARTVIHT